MKKSIFLIAVIVAALSACNFLHKQSKPNKVHLITHKEEADTMRLATIDTACIDSLTKLIEYGYLGSERSKELLRQVNLASFLLSGVEEGARTFNGFYGDDRYRIEFYIREASIDTTNPFMVNLTGKCKYKTNITDFTGRVNIDSLFAFRDLTYDYREFLEEDDMDGDASRKFEGDTNLTTYHAKGTFMLLEDSNEASSGTFKGNFYVDFIPKYNRQNEKVGYNLWYNTKNETKRGGFLFDGNWTSVRDTVVKPVIFAADLFMFGNEILEDFSYGEREIEINPKYRALGWDDYWEANEWWSDKNDSKVMMIWKY